MSFEDQSHADPPKPTTTTTTTTTAADSSARPSRMTGAKLAAPSAAPGFTPLGSLPRDASPPAAFQPPAAARVIAAVRAAPATAPVPPPPGADDPSFATAALAAASPSFETQIRAEAAAKLAMAEEEAARKATTFLIWQPPS